MNASEGSDLAKRKMHIVWNEDNLSYNEANKSVGQIPGHFFSVSNHLHIYNILSPFQRGTET